MSALLALFASLAAIVGAGILLLKLRPGKLKGVLKKSGRWDKIYSHRGDKFPRASNMVSELKLNELLQQESFVPQAILRLSPYHLGKSLDISLEEGVDDLDHYVGAALSFEGWPVAIMRYDGHPSETSTIYLPYKISDVVLITKLVHRLIDTLGLDPSYIVWERQHELKNYGGDKLT